MTQLSVFTSRPSHKLNVFVKQKKIDAKIAGLPLIAALSLCAKVRPPIDYYDTLYLVISFRCLMLSILKQSVKDILVLR